MMFDRIRFDRAGQLQPLVGETMELFNQLEKAENVANAETPCRGSLPFTNTFSGFFYIKPHFDIAQRPHALSLKWGFSF